MKLEICIKAGGTVKQELLTKLSELVPVQLLQETSGGDHSDNFVISFFFETKSVDDLLQSIAAVVAKIENRYPFEEAIDLHVRDIDCSEPTQCSSEYGVPFSPVEGIRLVPWDGREDMAPKTSDILLEPAQAFGTGLHPSTRLCLQILKQTADGDSEKKIASCSVLDIGCGSGILIIAALKLGAARGQAIEIDPIAVQVARKNLQINGLAHSAQVMETSWQNVTGQHDLILANLVPSVLYKAAPSIAKLLSQDGMLITAGFPASKNTKTQELFEHNGLRLLSESSLNKWGALLLIKQ